MEKMPLYLFSNAAVIWKKAAERLRSAEGIALFLDYDGTLTSIRPSPSKAVLSKATAQTLRRLSRLPDVQTTIVTGRSMRDIRRLVPIDNIGFAANHGIHILHDGKEWIHPDVLPLMQSLKRLHAILRNALGVFPKAYVENKKFTLSVHYRNIPLAKVNSLKSSVRKAVRSFDSSLILTRGKKVLEVKPPIVWDKGCAVLKLLKSSKRSRLQLPLFIGDDITDEDVFHVLRASGITVRVGKSSATEATFYVKDVDETHRLLQSIIEIRTHSSDYQRS